MRYRNLNVTVVLWVYVYVPTLTAAYWITCKEPRCGSARLKVVNNNKTPMPLFNTAKFNNNDEFRLSTDAIETYNPAVNTDDDAEFVEPVEMRSVRSSVQVESVPNTAISFTATTSDTTLHAILAASEEAAAAAAAAEASLFLSDLYAPSSSTTSNSIPTLTGFSSQREVELTSERQGVVGAIPDDSVVTAPSVTKVLMFAIPAMGVWLCNPLLSLIDTSAVGIWSGTVQQAALNPAVAVTDYSALLMAFLYTGTTNLIAAACVQDRNDSTAPRTSRTLIGVLQLSTLVGAGLGFILLFGAHTLLRALIGNDSMSPAVLDAARKYVRIRALGMPAAALIGSAQAACIGMQDIQSPLYVLLAAAIVNFVGDMIFVGSTHPWIGGAAGAAWATVFSQYSAAAMFIYWLRHNAATPNRIHPTNDNNTQPSKIVNVSNAILELMSSKPTLANKSRRKRFVESMRTFISPTVSEETVVSKSRSVDSGHTEQITNKETNSARGFLEGKLRKRDLISFPNQQTMLEFAPYVIPVTTTVIGRLSGYVAMSHVVSSSLGTVSMAAQQVIVSLFYCLCPIADSLSLTAQSFFPAISESAVGPNRSRAMKQTAAIFFKAGGVFGAVMVAAVSCIPFFSGFFTTDPNVRALVNMVVPYLMGFFAVHGIVCGSEGLLLGRKDLGFLGKMYAGFFAVVPYLMLRVKNSAVSAIENTSRINLTSVWKIFVGYQIFRAIAWSARLTYLQRQTELEAPLNKAAVTASS
jgi:Na+-driven multidrug efflux pump